MTTYTLNLTHTEDLKIIPTNSALGFFFCNCYFFLILILIMLVIAVTTLQKLCFAPNNIRKYYSIKSKGQWNERVCEVTRVKTRRHGPPVRGHRFLRWTGLSTPPAFVRTTHKRTPFANKKIHAEKGNLLMVWTPCEILIRVVKAVRATPKIVGNSFRL